MNIKLRERNRILPKLLSSGGWGSSTNQPPKDNPSSTSIDGSAMMFEENIHQRGLTLADSYDILTKKNLNKLYSTIENIFCSSGKV